MDNIPSASSSYLRYVDAEIGRGRFSLRTEPMAIENDGNMTWPGLDNNLSCSLWDLHEVRTHTSLRMMYFITIE